MLLGLLLGPLLRPRAAQAKVFYARDEAFRLAFPEAEIIDRRTFFLTPEQVRAVEARARTKLDTKLVSIYVARKGRTVLGYAVIDIHTVRTLPEAVMIVLTPEGRVVSTLILAFYEPQEYLPPARWLRQFERRALAPELWVGRGIDGITGATLSAWAITQAVRKALALYQVLLEGGR